MRNFLVVQALLPMLLAGGDLTVDHVTIAGARLKDLEAAMSAIGIRSDYGGSHLELIALEADADPNRVAMHPWSRSMQANAGPCAWAVRAGDLKAVAKR